MSTGNVLLDVTQYVRINIGLNPMLLQSHRDTVRIVFSDSKPVVGNSAFHQLGGDDQTLNIPFTDVNVWALAMTDKSSLTVTEFPQSAITELPKTAFGDLRNESLTVITQISGHYDILSNVLTVLDDAESGTNSIVDSMFTCDTGTSSNGLASILTLRQLTGRSGQGGLCRLSTVFDTAVADTTQICGLITAENSFVFGYTGTNFGIIHAFNGVDELQELTLTAAAAGAETATVTVNGNPFSVELTGVGTVEGDAFEIAASLNAQVPNYNFTSNGDQVVAQAVLPIVTGSFAYSSSGTSVGSWVQNAIGTPATQLFTPQSLWNRNTFSKLIPQKGNEYQIQFQHDFGAINFFIYDGDTGKPVLVHQIEHANNSVLPSVSNPTFRIGWLVNNSGNTSNVRLQGSSASAFIEGKVFHGNTPLGVEHEQLAVGATLTNVLSIRNRISFGGKVNRAEILPLLINAASQTNKTAFFTILVNPTFESPLIFNYKNKASSLAEISTDAVTVSGGINIGTAVVVDGAPGSIRFNEGQNRVTAIPPGAIVCLAARMSSGAAADCQGSLTFQEDL